jgi:hypothetical protein
MHRPPASFVLIAALVVLRISIHSKFEPIQMVWDHHDLSDHDRITALRKRTVAAHTNANSYKKKKTTHDLKITLIKRLRKSRIKILKTIW